ncbi:hypothetical protein KAR04_04275 [Candidatus Calescamantes bacterium]|nr:hypothetical protein [Candidatus Calescamantes bacterium]
MNTTVIVMKIKRKELIMLSTAYWDEPSWTNKQHIATEFHKKGYSVLYIEPPLFIGRFLLNMIQKVKRLPWYKKLILLRKIKKGFFVFSTFYIFPARFHELNYRLGTSLILCAIRMVKLLLGFSKPYLINYLPNGARYIGQLSERSSLYDCVDEYSGMAGIDPRIVYLEQELLRKVDAVAVTARGLYERKKPYNSNTHIVHNVGNSSLFDREKICALPVPIELKGMRNIVGFIGAVNFKIDIELMKYLLDNISDADFVFIGPVYDFNPADFKEYGNFHLLGSRPLDRLPEYVSNFKIGIIPYLVNEYTKYVFPLKLFEFFSARIPVIATALPEIMYYKDIAYIESQREKFLNTLKKLICGEITSERLDKGYDVASKYDWSWRANELEKLLRI